MVADGARQINRSASPMTKPAPQSSGCGPRTREDRRIEGMNGSETYRKRDAPSLLALLENLDVQDLGVRVRAPGDAGGVDAHGIRLIRRIDEHRIRVGRRTIRGVEIAGIDDSQGAMRGFARLEGDCRRGNRMVTLCRRADLGVAVTQRNTGIAP